MLEFLRSQGALQLLRHETEDLVQVAPFGAVRLAKIVVDADLRHSEMASHCQPLLVDELHQPGDVWRDGIPEDPALLLVNAAQIAEDRRHMIDGIMIIERDG